MRTVSCNDCGHEIAVDDYIVSCCPICDSFMNPNRLNKKVDVEIESIIKADRKELWHPHQKT